MQKRKNILLVTNHFYPETFRCNDIAFEMAKRGHRVKVLTGIPDYPQGKYHEGYSVFKKRVEKIRGVEVVRVPVIPRGDGSKLRMIIHYASSVCAFMAYALYQAVFHTYEVVYVHDTSPAFIALPAVLLKKLRKTPVVLWILDMWPESLIAGGVRSHKVHALVGRMMKMIYRNSDRIQISSLGFRSLLTERGVSDKKIEYLPNWSDDAMTGAALPLPDEIKKRLPHGFKIMFAGNMGEAQNLENIMKAALLLKNEKIQFVFLGDGRKKKWVEEFVSTHGLKNTVHLLGRQPMEYMPAYFAQASIMLVALCNEPFLNLTLPAKVQAYMSCAKPILGFMNGEGRDIIEKSGCGWAVPADEVDGFAAIVRHIASLDESTLAEYGRSGSEFYQSNLKKDICMNRVESSVSHIYKGICLKE